MENIGWTLGLKILGTASYELRWANGFGAICGAMVYMIRFAKDWRRGVLLASLAGVLVCVPGMRAQEAAKDVGRAAANAAAAAASKILVPRVEPILSMRRAVGGVAPAAHKKSYDFTLKDSQWLDTGVSLAAGEVLKFAAAGEFSLGDLRAVGPDGVERGFRDLLRNFPLNSAKTGELIGRVSDMGASVPFAIGAQSDVTMPTSGRLFLRINASDDLAGTGEFKVKVNFPASAKAVPGGRITTGVEVSSLVSPETFEDIPRRVSDKAGHHGDMVNYALIGTQTQVEAAFKAAGWVVVDKSVEDAVLHGLLATLSHEAYTEMPMSTLYLFGRPQDLSFARGDPLKVAMERHHLRVWKTDRMVGGAPLWVGSATHDVGFETDQRNGDVTHKIDPKVDGERDYLLQSFDAAGMFSSAAYVTPEGPLREAQTATGGSFSSDGRILVMALK